MQWYQDPVITNTIFIQKSCPDLYNSRDHARTTIISETACVQTCA